jgi:hypothetical protein
VHASKLDRELAAGVASWASPRHAARSLQLTGARQRRSLAGTIERLAVEARRPPLVGNAATLLIRPARRAIIACEPQLNELSAILRSAVPVTAGGVASLKRLLTDGTGPLYAPDAANDLSAVLGGIRGRLQAPV